MKARSFLPLVTLALFGTCATASFAGEGKTYKIVMRERYQAGDVVTKVEKAVDTQHVVVKGPDGTVVQEQKPSKTVTYDLLQKAVEVDEQGRVTKGLLYFKSWSSESDAGKDESLTGLHVEYAGRGKLRTWKVLTPGKTPGEAAAEYLDKEYGNKKTDEQESIEGVLEPKKEVEVGESWNPEVAELAKAFGDQFKLDLSKSTAKATLTGVEGTMGEYVIEIALQTLSVPSPGGELTWKEGGLMKMKMDGKHSLVEGDPSGSGKLTFELKGTADAGGVTIVLEVTGTKDGSSKKGGEMPAVPAAETK